MKTVVVLLALALTSQVSQARTLNCVGSQKDSVNGQLQLEVADDGSSLQVTGGYEIVATQEIEAQPYEQINCTAALHNAGQSGIKGHDYFQSVGACAFDYIRTSKGDLQKNAFWIELVKAGASDHDSSGYTYDGFFCR